MTIEKLECEIKESNRKIAIIRKKVNENRASLSVALKAHAVLIESFYVCRRDPVPYQIYPGAAR